MKALGIQWMAVAVLGMANLNGQVPSASPVANLPAAFEEPLVPLGGEGSPQEWSDLAAALRVYQQSGLGDEMGPLEGFLSTHPGSAWRASLRMNMGLALRRSGWPSSAMTQFEAAWKQTKADPDERAKWIADRAVTEWMWLCVKAGNDRVLEKLLRESEGRPMRGGPAQRRLDASRALYAMQKEAKFYLCGPTALATVKSMMKPGNPVDPRDVKDTIPGPEGTSLFQLAMMASNWDIPLQMLKRAPGSNVLVPSVVHWKTGHWAAVIQEAGDRYLVKEDVLEEAVWVRREALDSDTTGYCLGPCVPLPQGWTRVSAEEGRAIWGRGRVGLGPWYGPYDDSITRPRMLPGLASVQVGVRMGNLSLEVRSTPISIPNFDGPAWPFEVRYQQRVDWQPDHPSFSHLGPHWMFTGLSYLLEDPSFEWQDVHLFTETGTWLRFTGFDPATGRYARNHHTRDLLVRRSKGTYELHRGDGSVETFSRIVSAGPSLNRIFRTEQSTPAGKKLRYEYDGTDRLRQVKDEVGHGFAYQYEDPVHPYRLSCVTDSHGREVRFAFDPLGRMSSISDAAGGKTRLTYDDQSLEQDVPTSLSSPDGTWLIHYGQRDLSRWVEWTDPGGKVHKAEFCHDAPDLPVSDAEAPSGPLNQYMHDRSTYYWAPEILARHRGDYRKAEAIRYLFNPTQLALSWSLEAIKQGDDPRIWFLYPGQVNTQVEGSRAQPTWIAQRSGTKERRWDLVWDDHGQPLTLRNQNGGKVTWADHAQSRVLLMASTSKSTQGIRCEWGAPGRLTQLWSGPRCLWEGKRDDRGKLIQVKDAKGRVWNLGYDDEGRWISITGPSSFHWTFDDLGRVATLQEGAERATVFSYDGLDRMVRKTDGERRSRGVDRPLLKQGTTGPNSFLEGAGLPRWSPVLPMPAVLRSWVEGARSKMVMPAAKMKRLSSPSQAASITRWIRLMMDLEPTSPMDLLSRAKEWRSAEK